MGIIAWIIVGLIAGWLTGLIMKGSGYGVIGDIILGIVGAIVGGFIAGALFGGDYTTGINIPTLVVAFIGAIIVVLVVRALPGRSPV